MGHRRPHLCPTFPSAHADIRREPKGRRVIVKWLWPKKNNVEAKIQEALKEQQTFLDLSFLGLESLPESLGQLTGLQSLFLGRSLLADARQTLACFFLSVALFLGLGLNYLFGFWQADPITGLLISAVLLREGYATLTAQELCSCCG